MDFQKGGEFLRVFNLSDRSNHYAPGIAGKIGMDWQYLCDEQEVFSVKLLWESICWWQQFKFPRYSPEHHNFSGLAERINVGYPLGSRGLFIEGVSLQAKYNF